MGFEANGGFIGDRKICLERILISRDTQFSIVINDHQSATSKFVVRMAIDVTNLPAIVFALGGLLNVGALAWWIRSGTDMKIAQRDATEAKRDAAEAKAKSTVLESRVNQQDTIIIEIRTRMAKLDRVDELVASAKFIEEAVRQIVPRSEQEAKWQTFEQRFARIEADVRNIQDHTTHPA